MLFALKHSQLQRAIYKAAKQVNIISIIGGIKDAFALQPV